MLLCKAVNLESWWEVSLQSRMTKVKMFRKSEMLENLRRLFEN